MDYYRILLDHDFDFSPSTRWSFNFNQDMFSCDLQCTRCMFIKNNGEQCNRKTCYTLPVCWQHLIFQYKVRIGQTQLRTAAGQRFDFIGLFACDKSKEDGEVLFKKHDMIVPYVAEKADEDRLEDRYGDFVVPYGLDLDDAGCVRSAASLINACQPGQKNYYTGPKKVLNCKNNAKFRLVEEMDGIHLGDSPSAYFQVVCATKNIKNGDEILVDYGASYFNYPQGNHETVPTKTYQRLNYKCQKK